MKTWLLVFVLVFVSGGYTETLPDAPRPDAPPAVASPTDAPLTDALRLEAPGFDAPRTEAPRTHEKRNFVFSSLYFSLSSEALNYADHSGARECKAEDVKAGHGDLFNTGKGYGYAPRTTEILAGGAAVLGGATVLELLHYHKTAKRVLTWGGSAQYGAAVAAFWSGCN